VLVNEPLRDLLDLGGSGPQLMCRDGQRLVALGREDVVPFRVRPGPVRLDAGHLVDVPDLVTIHVDRGRECGLDASHPPIVGRIPLGRGRSRLWQVARVLPVRDEDGSAAGPFRIELVNSGLQSLRIFIDLSLHLVEQVTVYIIPAG
jgi:hypothetical protein